MFRASMFIELYAWNYVKYASYCRYYLKCKDLTEEIYNNNTLKL